MRVRRNGTQEGARHKCGRELLRGVALMNAFKIYHILIVNHKRNSKRALSLKE